MLREPQVRLAAGLLFLTFIGLLLGQIEPKDVLVVGCIECVVALACLLLMSGMGRRSVKHVLYAVPFLGLALLVCTFFVLFTVDETGQSRVGSVPDWGKLALAAYLFISYGVVAWRFARHEARQPGAELFPVFFIPALLPPATTAWFFNGEMAYLGVFLFEIVRLVTVVGITHWSRNQQKQRKDSPPVSVPDATAHKPQQ